MSLTTSIVIPSYYRAFEVRNLFESILKNTRKPLEVLVVDDTPCDEIEHLCKDFEKEFSKANAALVYVRNPRERSSAVARNVGVENARGDIILFLDSDLSLYPDYMKKILEVFERDPAVLGVQGWIINYWASRWALRRLFYAKLFSTCHPSKNSCRFGEYPAILDTVSRCEYLFGANMAYRRKVFDMGFRFDENLEKLAYMEDALISCKLHRKNPESLYITPYARCIHKESPRGREKDYANTSKCRKYVLVRLFGWRGLILHCRQTIGEFIVRLNRYRNSGSL